MPLGRERGDLVLYLKRAFSDILSNGFLNSITILTIAFSIFVLGVFILFFENAERFIDSWNQEGRMMAYLDDDFDPQKNLLDLKTALINLDRIQSVDFISKAEGLENLKNTMKSRAFLFDGLDENPLPDAFLITLKPVSENTELKEFAVQIMQMPFVQDVEYGEAWLDRFKGILKLFRSIGYIMICVFCVLTFFIISNTIRLSLYSRQEEVEIMRLVGATDRFIAVPFYVEGVIQGTCGGILSLGFLFILYAFVSPYIVEGNSFMIFNVKFLTLKNLLLILFSSSFLGLLGCYVSLRYFLKK